MAAPKQKNRRYRNAKISEYRLRRVVECMAKDLTVAETADATKLSRQAVDTIFMRIRERLRDHGLVRFEPNPNEPSPARFVFNPKHRGVPERYHDLYAIELINRVLCAQNLKGFEELAASNPAHVKRAIRLSKLRINKMRRYAIIERKPLKPGETEARLIPFDPLDYDEAARSSSTSA